MINSTDLRKEPCPECGRKGLHFRDHPHALGYKDYSRVQCRFCRTTFKVKEK